MRSLNIVLFAGTLLATCPIGACSGCGASEHPTSPPVGSAVAAGAATDEEGDEASNELGNEGDDDTPPLGAASVTTAVRALGSAALHAEAERQLTAMTSTTYSHQTHIDEARGTFAYDCSGFVDYALSRAAPAALADLRRASVQRPLAKHYVAFFQSLPANGNLGRWHRVARVIDLVPGDIVAWLRPADSASKNTGHVMIVHGAPEQGAAHANGVVVPVVDSTAARHGKGDTRLPHASGLGAGAIVLVVDASGAPVHYRWTRARSREHASTITLAHLD